MYICRIYPFQSEMPCWYFEKKEIRNSASSQQGIEANTEARYRREGARLILDAGNKLGLRYDTCATGVVYFHRFYMFHSFKEFHRYVTAACCLFLAGKVEETPKKCKDIIRTCHSLLTPHSFSVFGDNPREEVMTQERILLQTIKFDLQVEHPHTFLLKYAKLLKGDKEKTQKIVQMAWTFINDSLCTTLCLQWEPEIVSVSLMYLASRLQKYEITDWVGKIPNVDLKWWEFLLEDLSMPLMEDVCHQVLDLYSQQNKDSARQQGDSPPPSPPKTGPPTTPASQSSSSRKPAASPADAKKPRKDTSEKKSVNGSQKSAPPPPSTTAPSSASVTSGVSVYNPYIDASMLGASFMNQAGSQTIQPLISGAPTTSHYPAYTQAPPTVAPQQYPSYPQSGYPAQTTYAQAANPQYTTPSTAAPRPPYTAPYAPNYPPPAAYSASSHPAPAQPYTAPGYPTTYPAYHGTQPPQGAAAYPPGAPRAPPSGYPARFSAPPQGAPRGPRPGPPGPPGGKPKVNSSMASSLASVRITGR